MKLRIFNRFVALAISFCLGAPCCGLADSATPPSGAISSQAALAASAIRVPEGMSVKPVASEPNLANPVAFCFDPQGRIFVVETDRLHKGVEDNRNHLDWVDDDLAARTVEDRRAYTVKRMGDQIHRFTEADDRVRLVEDRDGDGLYEHSTVFSDGYKDVQDGAASGALWVDDRLLLTNIPSLYELRDRDGDGYAEQKRVLATGFGVHFALIGHDLHGLCLGPDGKIYFSIGDRGLHVKTPEGVLSNPDSGAVLRCNVDGSELELFATGLRNPQELAFNELGDLFTVDNNSDSGDRARLVHIVEGMHAGWRMSYQYLGDRGPFNREKIWHTQNDEQPATIVPPLAHLSDGPSGLVRYPGTGMPSEHEGAFFLCDFRGQAGGSGVREFWIEPSGATYKLKSDRMFVEGVLATDCDFGPDGALYISDWVDGWNGTGLGRIHRVASDDAQLEAERQTTQATLERIPGLGGAELLPLLGHRNQRVRALAQQRLVAIGQEAAPLLSAAAEDESLARLARIHAIWGLGQLAEAAARESRGARSPWFDAIATRCSDKDAEIRAQAARTLSRARKLDEPQRVALGAALVPLLADDSTRVRSLAAISLGELQRAVALAPLLQMAKENDDRDPVLRHAVAMGLAGSQSDEALVSADEQADEAQRVAIVAALNRQRSALVARFLDDEKERVRLEAARVIWDLPLPEAYPALAAAIERAPSSNEPLLRRALAANNALGAERNLEAVIDCALRPDLSAAMREHAWEIVRDWAAPSSRDPVHGQWRPLAPRNRSEVVRVVEASFPQIVATSASDPAGVIVAAELGVAAARPLLIEVIRDADNNEAQQARALAALGEASEELADEGVEIGLRSERPRVRASARRLLVARFPSRAAQHLREVLESSTMIEQQAALDTLASLDSPAAHEIIGQWMDKVEAGSCAPELTLEVLEAASRASNPVLNRRYREHEERAAAMEPAKRLASCLSGGNADRGRRIFEENAALSCRRCHAVAPSNPLVGPNLSDVGIKRTREELLTSIVAPNAKIAEGFQTVVMLLDSGKVATGIVRRETDTKVVLVDADGKEIEVDAESIDDRYEGKSAMPVDLLQHMTERDLRDLVEFLSQLRRPIADSGNGGHGTGHGGAAASNDGREQR